MLELHGLKKTHPRKLLAYLKYPVRRATSLHSVSKPDNGTLLLRSSFKLSIALPKLMVSMLLREIIRDCVGDGITIRRRVQCCNENYKLRTRCSKTNATTFNSVSKCDRGTLLLNKHVLCVG